MLNLVKNLVFTNSLVVINIESEDVIGQLVFDEYTPSGIGYKSVICPDFIIEDNKQIGGDLTGFYGEVTDLMVLGDEIFITFSLPEERQRNYYRLHVIKDKTELVSVINGEC